MDNSAPIIPRHYDYIGIDKSGSTSDVYTYFIGGSSGDLQGTVTVNYSSTTKDSITSVVRT